MKNKIIGIFICTLMIATAIPCFGNTIGINNSVDTQVFLKEKNFNKAKNLVLPHETITMRHHLLKRIFLLYVPTSYDGTTSVSLVVFFHGGENTAVNASGRYGVSEKAEEEGFIVVYPDAAEMLGDSWLLGYGLYSASKFDELGRLWVDDIGFVKKIITKMQKEYNIDPKRIYLAGNSNGAMMAYRVGVEFSDIVAAVASNGGTIGGHLKDIPMYTIPEPANPVPIVEFHGKLDRTVPYNGGWNSAGDVFYASVVETISFWVDQNGCNPDPVTNTIGNVTIDRYTGGIDGTEVLLYSIANKGHVWFGGQLWEDPTPEISTTEKMWEFFEAHPKQ